MSVVEPDSWLWPDDFQPEEPPMTRNEIDEFFGNALPLVELRDLEAAANADPGEGCEWLPYYKMALNRLVECCGVLRALVDNPCAPARGEVLSEAGRLFRDHLLLSGLGPNHTHEDRLRVEEIADATLKEFIGKGIHAKPASTVTSN